MTQGPARAAPRPQQHLVVGELPALPGPCLGSPIRETPTQAPRAPDASPWALHLSFPCRPQQGVPTGSSQPHPGSKPKGAGAPTSYPCALLGVSALSLRRGSPSLGPCPTLPRLGCRGTACFQAQHRHPRTETQATAFRFQSISGLQKFLSYLRVQPFLLPLYLSLSVLPPLSLSPRCSEILQRGPHPGPTA